MSGTLADVEARIGTVHKLSSVITAMRGIAASRTQEAERHLDGIRAFAETIGDAIGQALALLPDADRPTAEGDGPSGHAVIVFAAEQGFAGTFSARVLDAAAPLLQEGAELLLIGDRGLSVAAERGLTPTWTAAMVAHPAQSAALSTRITDEIYALLAKGRISRVSAVHALPGPEEANEIVVKRLVPFDYGRFPVTPTQVPPLITLPPERLVARLASEYIFAELSEAVMLSFAAENEARMRAMIAAHDNVAGSLDTLVGTARRLRQEEITEEIVELATSSLSAR